MASWCAHGTTRDDRRSLGVTPARQQRIGTVSGERRLQDAPDHPREVIAGSFRDPEERAPHAGGSSGGARGGFASKGEVNPCCLRCRRILSITAGSVISATTSISILQRGHTIGLTSNTLRINRAQACRRTASAEPGRAASRGVAALGTARVPATRDARSGPSTLGVDGSPTTRESRAVRIDLRFREA